MVKNQFTLPVPDDKARRLVTGWLSLGLAALVIPGLYAILIVLSRTPFLQDIVPGKDFFRTALVIHVDLTVLVWFIAFAGVFWSYTSSRRALRIGWSALWLASLGTAVIVIAPFIGESRPLMNNYVPVLQNPVFFAGLSVFGLGFLLLILRSCATTFDSDNRTRYAVWTTLRGGSASSPTFPLFPKNQTQKTLLSCSSMTQGQVRLACAVECLLAAAAVPASSFDVAATIPTRCSSRRCSSGTALAS